MVKTVIRALIIWAEHPWGSESWLHTDIHEGLFTFTVTADKLIDLILL